MGFANPIGAGLYGQRIDQGVDYGGQGNLYALGDGVIQNVYGSGWPGGTFIALRLNDGRIVFYAESITPHVAVGQHVHGGQLIGYATGGGIEVGWAANATGTAMARAAGQTAAGDRSGDAGRYSTGYGVNFSNLVKSLGGPGGKIYGPVQGSVASNYGNPPASSGLGGLTGNYAVIARFLASKGLNNIAIAGVLGNIKVESNGNPGSGAIDSNGLFSGGIASWNGGLYTQMVNFAHARGKSQFDLGAQLDFLWSQIGGMAGALNRQANPEAAARYFDFNYERSGDIDVWGRGLGPQRVSAANSFYGNIGGGSGDMSAPLFSAGSVAGPNADDYVAALGNLGGLLNTVPELKAILDQAVSGGWSSTKFQQAVERSGWYRTHNASARELIALQASDPAEYQARLNKSWSQILEISRSMGVSLFGMNAHQIAGLAQTAIIEGMGEGQIRHYLASKFFNPHAQPQGQAAQYFQQLAQVYDNYGVPYNFATLQYRTQQMLAGNQTLDTYKQQAINQAKGMYPGAAASLDAGLTVRDIAEPYMQSMGNILEVNPNRIDIKDPLIQNALRGSAIATTTGGKQNVAMQTPSMTQFEQTLRQDPRWQYTNNAKDSMSSALVHIGRDLGFGF